MKLVISQPMFFPWIGFLELLSQADLIVMYDDVQLVRGFTNRVQIKTEHGVRWLSVPLRRRKGQRMLIQDVMLDSDKDWRDQHLAQLSHAYKRAPHYEAMIEIVKRIYAQEFEGISELSWASTRALCEYFGVAQGAKFLPSSQLNAEGAGSQRILNIAREVGCSTYISAQGGKNYLEHEVFEAQGIDVVYADYSKLEYTQDYGEFTPFVSGLDAIAQMGPNCASLIKPQTQSWRDACV